MRIFSHRHENSFSSAREFFLMGTRIPSVRGAEQPSDGSGRERDAGRPDPPLHRPSGFPWSPFPSPYIIEQISGASLEPPMPRGVQPVFSRRVGQPGRGGRPVVSRCVARRSGATASPFRRNGIAVPAQRHHRSGATTSPFRRNGRPKQADGVRCVRDGGRIPPREDENRTENIRESVQRRPKIWYNMHTSPKRRKR